MRRRSALLLLAWVPLSLIAKNDWQEGQLVGVDMKDFMTGKKQNKIQHRYICTVGGGEFNYVVEFEKPLKVAVHDPVKFVVKKDKLIIQDADGKERSARIEKRERIAR